MKFFQKFNFPQKSIFGFTILSSLHSSISCYILLLIGKSLNLLFGDSEINIIAGSMFNIVLNLSIFILIINIKMLRFKTILKIDPAIILILLSPNNRFKLLPINKSM